MPWRDLKFKALLFDLDGTLIDSMPLHNRAWKEILADHGCVMTDEILTEYTGVPNRKTVEIFNKRFGWKLNPEHIADLKETRFLQILKDIKTIKITVDVARENFGKVPMAIVTGSVKAPAIELIKLLDIEKYFSVVVTAEDTKNHKPDPEPFLLAARKLGVEPQKCLVFEDGALGIQGAHAAGMKVIKVVADPTTSSFRFEPQ
ncbi:MAG: HAD family hydrolase [Pseudobdellovibrio sp.]